MHDDHMIMTSSACHVSDSACNHQQKQAEKLMQDEQVRDTDGHDACEYGFEQYHVSPPSVLCADVLLHACIAT